MESSYTNYEWFLKSDLSQYAGKWLAIVDQKIIAVGKNAREVIEKAKKQYPQKRPFVTKVRDQLSIL